MRKWSFSVAVLMVLALVAGCGGSKPAEAPKAGPAPAAQPAAAAAPIKLGAIVPKSGKGADWGKKEEIAAKLAVDKINAAGGINGSKVEMVIVDNGGDPQQGLILTRRLAEQDKVAAILGPTFTATLEVTMPEANKIGIPMVGVAGPTGGLTGKNRPWTYKNAVGDAELAPIAVPKFVKFYNVKKVLWIQDEKDTGSINMGKALVAAFKAAGVEVVNESAPVTVVTDQADFSVPVTKLKDLAAKSGAQAIVAGLIYQVAAPVGNEMARQGLKLPVMGGVGFQGVGLFKFGADKAEGWVGTSVFWDGNPDPEVQAYVKDFSDAAQKAGLANPAPEQFDSNMYDSVMITAKALKDAKVNGATDLAKQREAIRDGWTNLKEYKGVTGSITVNGQTGEAVKPGFTLVVKSGKFTNIE